MSESTSKLTTAPAQKFSKKSCNYSGNIAVSQAGLQAARSSSRGFEAEAWSSPEGDGDGGIPQLRRRKESMVFTASQVSNVIAAAEHAKRIGLHLNKFVTIDWQLAEVADPISATGRFLKLFTDGLRKRGGQNSVDLRT